jgi:hypothetical protein
LLELHYWEEMEISASWAIVLHDGGTSPTSLVGSRFVVVNDKLGTSSLYLA